MSFTLLGDFSAPVSSPVVILINGMIEAFTCGVAAAWSHCMWWH